MGVPQFDIPQFDISQINISQMDISAIIVAIIVIYYTIKIYELKEKQSILEMDLAEIEKEISTTKLESLKEQSNYTDLSLQIYNIKKEQSEIERQISTKNLEFLETEHKFKTHTLSEVQNITNDISRDISKRIIDDPTWLDRFMDETGATYVGSVYGKRIKHFYYEKKILAKAALDSIESDFRNNNNNNIKYCLVIDSGTTMYHIFHEICERMRDEKSKNIWVNRVYIITNNLPGVQYLMKNCKENPSNDYSEIAVKCFLLPGKTLSVYAAVACKETVNWLSNIDSFLQSEWDCKKDGYQIISFITANYISRHPLTDETDAYDAYYPVARGEGHIEVKEAMVKVSDKIFLISPLLKFSLADVGLLNEVNGFSIPRSDITEARLHPSEVEYEEIPITDRDKCIFFTTSRKGEPFSKFSDSLRDNLIGGYTDKNVIMVDFDLKNYIPNVKDYPHLEIEREIPHEILRTRYINGSNIWDMNWVSAQEMRRRNRKSS
ncbi:MAG: hypothetical protein PHF18_03975 [Methanosarcina sp.]|uniref:hypothetical protein n=1 Tax=Methanosarcina sp. TaxID=2213 RepID=UPI0026031D4E|nr:hypothetical protein [Methanosarcina sp.]MDD3246007.1 hypothetical protein [Methanosarcina sp.]MDD3923388.1 hypothetical protein [Endomicrobiaceae bacterium]